MKLPQEIFAQHIAVLGKTGSGKSSALRVMVEKLLDDNKPVCIVDPKGDWFGLKSSASGKSAGYPVIIFGGEHADVPLNEHSGKHVAELIATGNRPAIIDLGGWMVGERSRFFIDFASTLFRTTRGARYLVIDEVHNFAPQSKIEKNPDAMKMLHWANRLASEGRGKGLTILSASQRPQKVHKDFLTCAETLVAMRVIHKLDRDAIKEWIDGAGDPAKGREVLDTLASNERGEAWVWSPEIKYGPKRVQFPMFKTYDSFAPKANDGTTKLKGWASVDLAEVTAKLAAVVEEAKANDPAELKKIIRDLEQKLKTQPAAVAPAPTGPTIQKLREDRNWWREHAESIGKEISDLRKRIVRISEATEQLKAAVDYKPGVDATATRPDPEAPPTVNGKHLPFTPKFSGEPGKKDLVQKVIKKPADVGDVKIGKAERAVLQAIYWTRNEETIPSKIAFYADYSVTSSTFGNACSALRKAGLLAGWQITESGIAYVKKYASDKPRGQELREWLRRKLGKAENALMDVIVEEFPERVSYEVLSERSGYQATSSTFGNALSTLRTITAAEGGQREGGVKANPVFFE